MLQPASPQSRRERMLVMGPYGSGKTSNWLNIARWSHDTGSGAKFYALDSDNALEAMLEPGTQYADLDYRVGGPVHWTPVYEWTEYEAAIDTYAPLIGPDDWTIIDFVSPAWEAVQNHYIAEIFKTDSAEYFLEARKAMKGGNPLDGWKDWQYINKLYKQWINQVLHRVGGHKYMTAHSEAIRETDDKAIRTMFGGHGVRPRGQKELGYQAHTILLGGVNRAGEVSITTIKDRERTPVEEKLVNEFTIDYLTTIAGWQL